MEQILQSRFLIIRASKDVCGQEIDLVKAHAEMLGLAVEQRVVSNQAEMSVALNTTGYFEYFYLCSHTATQKSSNLETPP